MKNWLTSHHSQRADWACDSGRRVPVRPGLFIPKSACAPVRAWLTSDVGRRSTHGSGPLPLLLAVPWLSSESCSRLSLTEPRGRSPLQSFFSAFVVNLGLFYALHWARKEKAACSPRRSKQSEVAARCAFVFATVRVRIPSKAQLQSSRRKRPPSGAPATPRFRFHVWNRSHHPVALWAWLTFDVGQSKITMSHSPKLKGHTTG